VTVNPHGKSMSQKRIAKPYWEMTAEELREATK
jgi:hypothetical protein